MLCSMFTNISKKYSINNISSHAFSISMKSLPSVLNMSVNSSSIIEKFQNFRVLVWNSNSLIPAPSLLFVDVASYHYMEFPFVSWLSGWSFGARFSFMYLMFVLSVMLMLIATWASVKTIFVISKISRGSMAAILPCFVHGLIDAPSALNKWRTVWLFSTLLNNWHTYWAQWQFFYRLFGGLGIEYCCCTNGAFH